MPIPHDTMRELRQRGDERLKYETAVGLPNTGQFSGYPVHLIDGNWYVDVTARGFVSPSEARELLKIQELIEDGDWKYESETNRIRVWEAGQWILFPMELVHRIQDEDNVNFLQDGEVIPARKVKRLKEALAEHEEEVERLALRQLLAESQQEGDDEIG